MAAKELVQASVKLFLHNATWPRLKSVSYLCLI